MKYYPLLIFMALLWGCTEKEVVKKPTQDQHKIKHGATGQHLDSLLTPYINKLRSETDNIAGLAIGITKNDKIIYAQTFGYADLEKQQKVDFNTQFHLASLSKPFSGVAVAKLIQENKLNLDDLLITYVPELKTPEQKFDKITVEHILTHTSGIPRNITTDDWTKPSYGPDALAENIAFLKKKELDFEPGSKFSYSNSAYDILGLLISRASSMPFDEYITSEVLEPLEMGNTSLKKQPDILPEDWAASYSYGINTQKISPYPYNERLFPSSGIVASIKDMCKWGQMHVGQGVYKGKTFLDKTHFDLVTTPKYETPWGDNIGLSWFLQSYLDRPIIMHTGFDTGFEAMIYIYPEEQVSITLLTNRDFSRTGRIINAASEILFGEEPKEYTISGRYKFAETYNADGIEQAKLKWEQLKKDTLDIYYTDDEDILTAGAILENGKHWKETKEILEYYLTLDQNSTYAWRLLGNAHLNLGDTLTAKSCYEQTLKINPDYEKGRAALEKLK